VPAQVTSTDDETSDDAPVDEETKHTKSSRAEVPEPDIRPDADSHHVATRAEPTPEKRHSFFDFFKRKPKDDTTQGQQPAQQQQKKKHFLFF
jgi:hypothetical protein